MSHFLKASTGCTVAFAMLAFYLLPGTVWSRLSPLNATPLFEYGGYTVAQSALVTSGILVVLLLFIPHIRRRSHTLNLGLLTLLYLIAYMLPSLCTLSVQTQSHCTLVLLALGTGLLASRLCTSPENGARVLTLIGAAQAGYALFEYVHRHNVMLSGSVVRAGGTFDQPNALSLVMVLCLPVTIALVLTEARFLYLVAGSICIAMMSAALILTWSRGAAFGIALALLWIIFSAGRNLYATGFAVVILLGLCSLPSVVRTSGSVNQTSSAGSAEGRLTLWKRGEEVFEHHWLTGVGAGSLEIPIQIKYPGGMTADVFMEPKSLVLHWLDEFGVAGGVLFLLLATSVGRCLAHSSSSITLGLAAAWLALLAVGVFDTPFGVSNRGYGNAIVGVLLGLTFLLTPSRRQVETRRILPDSPSG